MPALPMQVDGEDNNYLYPDADRLTEQDQLRNQVGVAIAVNLPSSLNF